MLVAMRVPPPIILVIFHINKNAHFLQINYSKINFILNTKTLPLHTKLLNKITTKMTNKTLLLHLILCVLLCVSCSQEHKDDYSELNKFIELNPHAGLDSVNTLIKEYKGNDEYTKMKLSILKYKCEDKCDIYHTSDSTIKALYEYFEKYGTIVDKMETNYYMGSTYRDMNNCPLAITYYNEAIKIGENTKLNYADSMLLANVYSQLSWMNEKANNPKEALEHILHALRIRQSLKIDDISSYQDVANCYNTNCNIDSAQYYYKRCALNIAYNNTIKENLEYICDHLQFFCYNHNSKLAKMSLEQLQSVSIDSLPSRVFARFALYYTTIDYNIDSCIYYSELAFNKEKNYREKAYEARLLSVYYAQKGNYTKTEEYALEHYLYEDSAYTQNLADETLAAQNKFKVQEVNSIKNSLQAEISKKDKLITYCLATSTIIFGILGFRLYVQKKRNNKYITEIEKIESEKTMIAKAHNTLTEIVNADKKLRAESAKNIASVMANINSIANDSKYILTEDMWEDIFLAVDRLHPDFRKHILTYYPAIENKELIIIYLVMLGQKQADVARLFNNARSVISRKFHRIDEKLGTTINEVIEAYTTQQNAIKAQKK